MKNLVVKTLSLSFVAAAITLVPVISHAEPATNPPSVTPPKKPAGVAFLGSVKAVDLKAETVMIGKKTYTITAATKITKGNKIPAKLSDLTIGTLVTGFYTKGSDGKLTAASMKISAPDKTKKKKPVTTNTSTNSATN